MENLWFLNTFSLESNHAGWFLKGLRVLLMDVITSQLVNLKEGMPDFVYVLSISMRCLQDYGCNCDQMNLSPTTRSLQLSSYIWS